MVYNFFYTLFLVMFTVTSLFAQQPEVQPSISSEPSEVKILLDVPQLKVSPVVKPITFNIGSLKVTADFIAEGAAAPHRGYLLRRSDVGLLQTVVDNLPDDFTRRCDARVDSCIDEVESCQEDCDSRTSLLIEDLEKAQEDLAEEREQHDSTRLRYTLYGFGGAIVSSLTTVLILRVAK